MKRISLIFAFALSSLLIGCASPPKGDPARDAALKTFQVPKDTTGVYIYRNEYTGASVSMDVSVDGKPIGYTGAKTYLYTEVSPGKHTISSEAENTSTLDIDAQLGTLLYIWQESKMGFVYARNKLQLVSEKEGQEGVMDTTLAVKK